MVAFLCIAAGYDLLQLSHSPQPFGLQLDLFSALFKVHQTSHRSYATLIAAFDAIAPPVENCVTHIFSLDALPSCTIVNVAHSSSRHTASAEPT
mmetsp:Transcript_41383/g.68843  ORF Transcript_41383/g.68843 Transcript_41383/m.68843 type:complete len:94 (-) Transcript_41383:80-361(-)